jgi:hypothetical protein
MPTVGVIAERLGEPLHRIEYVLRTRAVKPIGMAGNSRVYDDDALDQIREELRRIDAQKDGAR